MSKFVTLVTAVVFALSLTVASFASVPVSQTTTSPAIKSTHATEMMVKKHKKSKKHKKTANSTVSHVEVKG
ncbi:MAG: hypothetical protein HQL06_10900 [Nitrospirae bacterium]|nr:hypothetical protein [Nitrospirota bacterium]